MAKLDYFLYGGLFLAGAVVTPVVVALTGNGDRSTETDEAVTFDTSWSEPSLNEAPTASFAVSDDREQILKDYETTSPEELRNIPTAIPQFALDQPTVPPYPNYWANIRIPTFTSRPLAPVSAPSTSVSMVPGDRPQPQAPLTNFPSFNQDSFQGNPTDEANTNELELQGKIQTPNSMDLSGFVDSAPAREIKLP